MGEEVTPVSSLSVKENTVGKLEDLDEEGVEDPKESEVSPVGLTIVEEVEDESLNVRADVKKWQNHIEEEKLDQPECLHFGISLFDF